jgi:choline dehydrogenase-like flavoprotein
VPDDAFDYVVVGAGAAGCVLAHRLTEDASTRVLLLEAGGPDRRTEVRIPAAFTQLFKTACDWNYETVPQPALAGRRLYWPRGRMLGGSTSMNAQMYVRGHPADYDAWAAAGAKGWTYEDVRPYFRRAESAGTLSIEPPRDPNPTTLAFLDAAAACGLPRLSGDNDGSREGVGLTSVTQRRGRRWSAADAYLRPAIGRRNLTVLTGAQATRVVLEGARAVGVAFVRADGTTGRVRARREVILAGGAINSPQLLLLSGVGPGAALQALGITVVQDLPGVGANLQDHLASAVVVGCRKPVSLVGARSLGSLARYLLLRRGLLTSNVGEACAFVRTRPELPAPDLELIFAPVPFVDHGLVPPAGHGITIGAIALQPRSVGTVSLASADPLAPPAIDPRYLSGAGGEDLSVLLHGLRLARRIFATEPLAAYAGDCIEPAAGVDSDAALAAFVSEQAETLYHPVGTCRMGQDATAVVDAELRVRGVAGLRVVDASVMPVIMRGHPMAATIMLAEKAADLVRAVRLSA